MVDDIHVEIDLANVGSVSASESVVWKDFTALVGDKVDVARLKKREVSRVGIEQFFALCGLVHTLHVQCSDLGRGS